MIANLAFLLFMTCVCGEHHSHYYSTLVAIATQCGSPRSKAITLNNPSQQHAVQGDSLPFRKNELLWSAKCDIASTRALQDTAHVSEISGKDHSLQSDVDSLQQIYYHETSRNPLASVFQADMELFGNLTISRALGVWLVDLMGSYTVSRNDERFAAISYKTLTSYCYTQNAGRELFVAKQLSESLLETLDDAAEAVNRAARHMFINKHTAHWTRHKRRAVAKYLFPIISNRRHNALSLACGCDSRKFDFDSINCS